jgi:hypothetical protein
MQLKLVLGAAALTLSIACGGAAGASSLYGTTYTGSTSDLYSINQTTGAATFIGSTGKNLGDLTNVGGSLVGIDLTADTLWTISATTGAASSGVAVTGTRGTITSVAWDPVTKTLYGDTTDAFSGSDILYQINATTGVATAVGGLGATDIYGLGFGQDGTLYGSDAGGALYNVSTTSGAASFIGNTGVTSVFDIASRPEDGVLFAGPADDSSLLTLNRTTGAGTEVGPFGASLNIAGLAFLGGAGGVPEPAAWAMMLAGFGLVGGAMRARRHRVALVSAG